MERMGLSSSFNHHRVFSKTFSIDHDESDIPTFFFDDLYRYLVTYN